MGNISTTKPVNKSAVEKFVDNWKRSSFFEQTPYAIVDAFGETCNMAKENLDLTKTKLEKEMTQAFTGTEYLEAMHITTHTLKEDKVEVKLDLVATKINMKQKFQTRFFIEFYIDPFETPKAEELAQHLIELFFQKPFYKRHGRIEMTNSFGCSYNYQKEEPVDNNEMVSDIARALVMGDKISLNRVPLFVHRDNLGETAKCWYIPRPL